MSMRSQNIPVLNGIRGLAVWVVFASHASNIFYGGALLGMGAGQLGVMLFFMLSGFLMAMLYMNKPLTPQARRDFLVNRFARIYPMFFLVVVAAYTINIAGLQFWDYPIKKPGDLLVHLIFIRGYDVLWTIGPEVIFYLLFLVLWKTRNIGNGVFVGTALTMVSVAWLPVRIADSNSLFALHEKLPFFIIGCVFGMHYEDWLQLRPDLSGRKKSVIEMAFWASLMLFAVSFPQVIKLVFPVPSALTGDPWPDPWAYPYYLVVTGMLFMTAVIAQPWILTNRVAGFIGKISFSVYLLHHVVLQNMSLLIPGHPVSAIMLAAIITLAASSLTYAIVEVPSRNLIRRLGRSHTLGDPAVTHHT